MLYLKTDKPLPPVSVLQGTGWSLELEVSGQSMEPVIRTGDTVTVKCTKPDDLQEGDVVCFQENGSFVLHRLVEVKGVGNKCFYEKGDAESKGSWISGTCVLGVLESVNGSPIDKDTADRIAQFSRRERNASDLLGKMGLSPQPSFLSTAWRKLKNMCRQSLMTRRR